MKIILPIFAFAICLFATLPTAAQTNGSNSPYSRYGYGLLADGGNAFNKGMSGTAYGFRNGTELNTKNPASYSAIDSLTFLFDFGMSFQNGRISQNNQNIHAKNTSVDYITAGFRLRRHLGMSIGLVPYSTIGYETSSTTSGDNEMSTYSQTNTFSGDGGLHEAYAGIGWEPVKGLSVGMNFGYLWGEMSHTMTTEYDNSSTNDLQTSYSADIRTYKADFGLQYTQRINSKHSLTLGFTYGLGHDVDRRASYAIATSSSSSSASGDTTTCHNAFALPHTIGVGLTWNFNNSLRVGADYTFQQWKKVKFPTLIDGENEKSDYVAQKGNFNNLHKVSLGVEYVPNAEGLRWRQRVRYRAGLSYATSYLKISGNDGPTSFTASVGAALPIVTLYNNRTFLNLGAQYEQVSPSVSGMLTERYFRFTLGITFNERWFMKWKAE